jgi:hypothetical protein
MKHRQPIFVRQLRRWIADSFAELTEAQRKMAAPDRYVFRNAAPPDTYEEFLFRTRGSLRHEPPARKRVACR